MINAVNIPERTYQASFLFSRRIVTALIISMMPAKNDQKAKKQINVTAEIKGLNNINAPAIIAVIPINNSHGLLRMGLWELSENRIEKSPSTIINMPKN